MGPRDLRKQEKREAKQERKADKQERKVEKRQRKHPTREPKKRKVKPVSSFHCFPLSIPSRCLTNIDLKGILYLMIINMPSAEDMSTKNDLLSADAMQNRDGGDTLSERCD